MKVIKLTRNKNGEIFVTSTGGTFDQLKACVEKYKINIVETMYFVIDRDKIIYATEEKTI